VIEYYRIQKTYDPASFTAIAAPSPLFPHGRKARKLPAPSAMEKRRHSRASWNPETLKAQQNIVNL
ncbi:MAG: hypothetical protein KDK04_26880, partial [Candidatus Competibacteraceae bacterium]|nr:hypothetical protein [Candidatus Competibacteraceae bacterium]